MGAVRVTAILAEKIDAILTSDREELLIAYGRHSLAPHWLLLSEDGRLAEDSEVTRDLRGLHWTGSLTSELYAEAKRTGTGVLLMHAHQGHGKPPRLSPTDRSTVTELLPHFGRLLPDVLHAYVVVNETHSVGWLQLGPSRKHLNRVTEVTCPLRAWPTRAFASPKVLPRDERQAAALGNVGVEALRQSTVGLVGLGGAGSQAAEMLAHAGVGHLIMVDADSLEVVNLSRTHGSEPGALGQLKVECAKAMVGRISPETRVTMHAVAFPTVATMDALRDANVVISAVDSAHARNELNRFSLRFGVPLLDIGTTITSSPLRVDGHLSLVLPGSKCLRCLGHVSDALLDEEQLADRHGQYGLSEGRPQVVSFNGLLASAAVTEVLKVISGFAGSRPASCEWHYDPLSGELRMVGIPLGRCPECAWYSMKGDST